MAKILSETGLIFMNLKGPTTNDPAAARVLQSATFRLFQDLSEMIVPPVGEATELSLISSKPDFYKTCDPEQQVNAAGQQATHVAGILITGGNTNMTQVSFVSHRPGQGHWTTPRRVARIASQHLVHRLRSFPGLHLHIGNSDAAETKVRRSLDHQLRPVMTGEIPPLDELMKHVVTIGSTILHQTAEPLGLQVPTYEAVTFPL